MNPGELMQMFMFFTFVNLILSYAISWKTVHSAIAYERDVQRRKQERAERTLWEHTHIPDYPDVTYRRA